MTDIHLVQSALAHLGLRGRACAQADAGVFLAEMPARDQLLLRGETADASFLAAVGEALGFELPVVANCANQSPDMTALWLGPNAWLLAGAMDVAAVTERITAELSGFHHALTDVSDSRAIIVLSGARARDLLAKATPLDLHSSVFGPGSCAQSTLGLTTMLLHQLADDDIKGPSYEIYVQRSFADYVWRWLEVSAVEFGLGILDPISATDR